MSSVNNKIIALREYFKIENKINISAFTIIIFTIYFSTINTPMLDSVRVRALILGMTVFILISDKIINKKEIIIFNPIDIFWMVFLCLLLISAFRNLDGYNLQDSLIYSLLIAFIILIKTDIINYNFALKLIKYFSVFYAVFTIFQFILPDLYFTYILTLFPLDRQEQIISLFNNNKYTGFTNQTAHNAGYLISGIALLIISQETSKGKQKVFDVIVFGILIYGLLLTGKRGHIIFTIIALILTSIASSYNKKQALNRMKIIVLTLISITSIGIIIYYFNSDSSIGRTFFSLYETVENMINGKDFSSGRFVLFKRSWELFLEKPIWGIGWRQFRLQSLNLISSKVTYHPHNMYLQLLSEMGILGFIFFMIPLLITYVYTFKLMRDISKSSKSDFNFLNIAVKFSFFTQTFFILYGLTGNVLNDYNFLGVYVLAHSITWSIIYKYNNKYSHINRFLLFPFTIIK